MKIELSNDTIDDIVCATLKEHMAYMEKSIKELKKKKGSLASHQAEDLGHNVKLLSAMEEVYGYFGGNL